MERTLLNRSADMYQPNLSVDCVILGFDDGKLKILLNKLNFADRWMLPGGFIFKDENIDDAAQRILTFRTGLESVYLTQFYTFGDVSRTNIEENRKLVAGFSKIADNDYEWMLQRFVTVGYYAFVSFDKVHLSSLHDEKIEWANVNELPRLYSDHNEIVNKAIHSIRMKLGYVPIGAELLPEKFTMSELRAIYETIIGKKLDRRNFQRKMLLSEIVLPIDEVSKKKGVKSAALFIINKQKQEECLNNETSFF